MASRQSGTTTKKSRAGTMFATEVDIRTEHRKPVVEVLNQRLADSLTLFSLTKQAHWNVKGKDFYQLHLLFDELAEIVEHHADNLAERAAALGGVAKGTVQMAASTTTLDDLPLDLVTGTHYLEALTERFGKHANQMRESIDVAEDDHGDKATADLFTELTRDLDKATYFLQSHLQA